MPQAQKERLLGAILKSAMDGFAMVDLKGRLMEVNDAYCQMSGYSESDLLTMSIFDLEANESPQETEAHLRKLISTGRNRFESRHRRKDGSCFEVEVSAQYHPMNGGRLVAFIRDISEHRQSEQALKESRGNLTALIENTGDIMVSRDLDGRAIVYNQAFARMVKLLFNVEAEPGMRTLDYLPEEAKMHWEKVLAEVHRGTTIREEFTWEIEGALHYFEISHHPIRVDDRIIGSAEFVRDITDKKAAEAALSESERRFRTIVENVNDGIYIHDFEGNIIDVNERACRMVGYARSDLVGKNFSQLDNLNDSHHRPSRMEMLLKTNRLVFEGELVQRDGSIIPVEVSAKVVTREGKGAIQGVVRDISERKKSEKQLRFQAKMLETIEQAVAVLDPTGRITYWNACAEKLFGWKLPEVLNRNVEDVIVSQFYKERAAEIMKRLSSGKGWSGEFVVSRRDGSPLTIWATNTPFFDDNGDLTGIIGIATDISVLKRLEAQLRQAQKMESIGNLAGGIAHDFNNLLFPIVGMAEILLEDLNPESQAYENAWEILRAGKRGRDLVKQILAFSRQGERKQRPVRVQRILKEVLSLCRASIPSFIEMDQDIQTDCGLISADPTQIHQVAMNIITNAYHAVEVKGGKITIQLKETDLSFGVGEKGNLEPGRYVVLSISDTGDGMSSDMVAKIFDPYFTTKAFGKGTGLGLAVAYGIIKDHKGDIRVLTEEGKGATFEIYLPVMEITAGMEIESDHKDHPKGGERILLVDDETAIVKLETQMLERLGYRVTARVNSLEALQAFKAKPHSYDLVLTDMTMPYMTGDQLSRELKMIRPDIPVIICTGYSDRINPQSASACGIQGYLMKPIVKSELAQEIRSVLDRGPLPLSGLAHRRHSD